MSYSFQSISSGAMLTSTFVNKIETNIQEHQHGMNSVTNLYGGNWTSVVTNASTAAHKFDTIQTFVSSGSKLLSICNSGTEKFAVYFDGQFNTSKISAYATAIQSIPNASFTTIAINTTTFDFLSEFKVSSNAIVPVHSGYYEGIGKVTTTVVNSNISMELVIAVNDSYTGSDVVLTRILSGYNASVQTFKLFYAIPTDYISLKTQHNAGASFNISSNSTLFLRRVL